MEKPFHQQYSEMLARQRQAKLEELEDFNTRLGTPALTYPDQTEPDYEIGLWKVEDGIIKITRLKTMRHWHYNNMIHISNEELANFNKVAVLWENKTTPKSDAASDA